MTCCKHSRYNPRHILMRTCDIVGHFFLTLAFKFDWPEGK